MQCVISTTSNLLNGYELLGCGHRVTPEPIGYAPFLGMVTCPTCKRTVQNLGHDQREYLSGPGGAVYLALGGSPHGIVHVDVADVATDRSGVLAWIQDDESIRTRAHPVTNDGNYFAVPRWEWDRKYG